MRRVRYDAPGSPLFLEEAPVPEPGPGELLVRCEAVGVTLPVVRKVTEAAEPIALGGEIAGEVVAVGDGVTRFRVGDRVTGLCFGHGYADFAPLHEAMASPLPDDASPVDAVALVRSGLVALGALTAAHPEPGESVLVTAAASCVGHLAVQLARVHGASRVVGAVSGAGKAEFVRALGADEVVAYDAPQWGDPVDYALDAVGGDLLGPAVAALAPGGRLVIAGATGGDRGAIPIVHLFWRQLEVIGTTMASDAEFRRALDLMVTASQRAVVDRTVALEDVPAALLALERGEQFGKIVVTR